MSRVATVRQLNKRQDPPVRRPLIQLIVITPPLPPPLGDNGLDLFELSQQERCGEV